MSNEKNWFSTGLGSFLENNQTPSSSSTNTDPYRFSIKTGETKKIIFLDDTAFHVREHGVFLDERFHHFTCLSVIGQPCPLCEAAKLQDEKEISIEASGVVAYSILDLTPFTSKKTGKVTAVSKKLLVAGAYAAKMLNLLRNNRIEMDGDNEIPADRSGGLKHHKFTVARTSDKAYRIGDHYEHYSKVNDFAKELKDNFSAELVEPVDYEKVFAPKTHDEVAAFAQRFIKAREAKAASMTSSSSTGSGTAIKY